MRNKKRIVFVEANEDGTIGGSHFCLLEIVKKINRDSFVPVVCFYQDNELVSEFKKYAEVYFIENPRGISFRRKYPSLYLLFSKNTISEKVFMLVQKIYNLIRHEFVFYLTVLWFVIKHKIDIIHLNNAPILPQWLVASKLTRTPLVAHVRGNIVLGGVLRKLVPFHDKVISISDAVTKFASEHGIHTEKFITIHDGIDIQAVKNKLKKSHKETLSSLGIDSASHIIGVVGNIKDWKGQHVLVEAVNKLTDRYPDLICLIVGDVSDLYEDQQYFELIKNKISAYQLQENVFFTGYRNDIPDIISILDIVIHTSTEPEPLGRVVLEGMLFAKPVIATAHGGPVEIIENNISGVLVKPSDPEALAEVIDNILSDRIFRKKLSENAVKRVEHCFSIESNVRAIEEQYRDL